MYSLGADKWVGTEMHTQQAFFHNAFYASV